MFSQITNKKFLILNLLLFVLLLFFINKIYKGKVIATINKEKIFKKNWDVRLEKMFGAQVLERMLEEKLVYQLAKKRGVVATKNEIEAEFVKFKDNSFSGNEKRFQEWLKDNKLTESDLKNQLVPSILLKKLIIRDTPEDKFEEFYNKYKDRYGEEAKIKVRHILLSNEIEADKVKKMLDAGASFNRLAQTKSMDVNTRAGGGMLGMIKKGILPEEFDKVAFSLPVGKISEPIKTLLGYHIIQVLKKPDTHTPMYEDIRDKVIEDYVAYNLDNWLKKEKKKAKIKNYWIQKIYTEQKKEKMKNKIKKIEKNK